MIGNHARNAYRQTATQANIHPVKLVHLMYERALLHLENAEQGIREKDPKKRGENLGKAIAIVTELSASIKTEDHSEAAGFLRGLYGSILLELPKASVHNDASIVKQARSYLQRLKEIWEETAMREHGFVGSAAEPQAEVHEVHGSGPKKGEIDVSRPSQSASPGLSVSI